MSKGEEKKDPRIGTHDVEGCTCTFCAPHTDDQLVQRAMTDPKSFIGTEVRRPCRVEVLTGAGIKAIATRIWINITEVSDDGTLEGEVVEAPLYHWPDYRGPFPRRRAVVDPRSIEAVRPHAGGR